MMQTQTHGNIENATCISIQYVSKSMQRLVPFHADQKVPGSIYVLFRSSRSDPDKVWQRNHSGKGIVGMRENLVSSIQDWLDLLIRYS